MKERQRPRKYYIKYKVDMGGWKAAYIELQQKRFKIAEA